MTTRETKDVASTATAGLWPNGAVLGCTGCSMTREVSAKQCANYLRRGWPRHCGMTMVICTFSPRGPVSAREGGGAGHPPVARLIGRYGNACYDLGRWAAETGDEDAELVAAKAAAKAELTAAVADLRARLAAAEGAREDAARLDYLERIGEASIGWTDDEPGELAVWEVVGSVNDREWVLRGKGDTLRQAVDAARAALAPAAAETACRHCGNGIAEHEPMLGSCPDDSGAVFDAGVPGDRTGEG